MTKLEKLLKKERNYMCSREYVLRKLKYSESSFYLELKKSPNVKVTYDKKLGRGVGYAYYEI